MMIRTLSRIASPAALLACGALLSGAAGICMADMPHAHGAAATRKAARPELGTSAAFAPDGSLYAVSKEGEHLLLQRSGDEGQSWSPPITVNAKPEAISADGENRPKIAFARDGAILLTWTKPLGKPYSGEIRFARAGDGQHFDPPVTVHRDRAEITHRFESLLVAGDGRIVVAWIDKRDLIAAEKSATPYRGTAIYAAISTDGGHSFQPERKIADHSCECCRIATAVDTDGAPLLMWRHVFESDERDHALTRLNADGTPQTIQRATFDHWKLDGCPHHGPSLAVDANGTRHAVWFNQKEGEGHVFYGRLEKNDDTLTVAGQRPIGGPRAEHADLATTGNRLAIVWKEFDGEKARLRAEVSDDGGHTFHALELAATDGASDQPRALTRSNELFAFWRSEREGMRVFRLSP